MCWNEHVSLNTFLLSSFLLSLILYHNLYTPYKIQSVHSLAVYLFLSSMILMQAIDVLLWRNLDNEYNVLLGKLGLGILLLQPIFGLSMIKEVVLREWLAVFYVFWVLALGNFTVEETRMDDHDQLEWGFLKDSPIFLAGWGFFLVAGPFYVGWIEFILVCLLVFAYRDRGLSMSYWLIHSLFIYYAILLFGYPLYT